MDKRCDRRADCGDGSDEQNCDIVDRGEGYNRMLTPISQLHSGIVMVSFTVDIEDILGVDEMKEIFLVKVSVKRDWKHSGLTYHNLKNNSRKLNALTDAEADSLWYPSVDINNIESKKMFRETSIGQVMLVVPDANYSFEIGDITHERNVRIFEGSENSLTFTKQWSVKFICHYNTAMNPFDTQVCRMEFVEGNNFLYLHPSKLLYNHNISLNRHFV